MMDSQLALDNQSPDLAGIEQLPTLAASAHDAASLSDRAIGDWNPLPASPDIDLIEELVTMVGRSRDLDRNNGIASGAEQTHKDNIIGSSLRLSAKPDYKLLGKTIDWAQEWADNTEAQFRSWAETTECDAGGELNLLGLTQQMFSGAFTNGDGLALPLWKPLPATRWATRLQVMESDRLDTPSGMEQKKNLSGGVQHDQHGRPIEYWIMKNHPGEKYGFVYAGADEYQRIPAFTDWGRRRVIHLHDKKRAGASRGKPLISSVMREFKMAGKYTVTELQTAIANSLIAAVLESDLDQETMNSIFGENAEKKYNEFLGGYKPRLSGGAVLKIPPGTKMHLLNAGRNNSAYDSFMQSLHRNMAVGLNIPYELLMKDFSNVNYSSGRMALLEAWRYFWGRRRWLSDYWLNVVYELWLEEAINLGRVEAPDYYDNKYAYLRCRWIMSGRGWVDPVKEANAAKIRMDIGVSTLENECAEQGLDWRETLEQRKFENDYAQELGLPSVHEVEYAPDVSRETDQDKSDDEEKTKKEESANA